MVRAIRTETVSVIVLGFTCGLATNKQRELQEKGVKTNQVKNIGFKANFGDAFPCESRIIVFTRPVFPVFPVFPKERHELPCARVRVRSW